MPRTDGSSTYSKYELTALLHYVAKYRPTGSNHWDQVAASYNDRVLKKGHSTRKPKNLKDKFFKLCKIKKPTGTSTVFCLDLASNELRADFASCSASILYLRFRRPALST